MKKIVFTFIVFAFLANVSAQIKVNSLGQVGIGNDPYGRTAALKIYNPTTPSFLLEGNGSRLVIGVAMNNGSYSTYAQTGDIVYTTWGGKRSLIFTINNSTNDGNQYIKFGDDLNGGWVSIYNNKKMVINGNVGIGKNPTLGMLDVAGSIYSSGNIVLTSDERLKKNIKPLSDEKEKLYLLQGKSYIKTLPPTDIKDVRYNEKGEEYSMEEKKSTIEFSEYGYLAQELKEVFPDLVSQDSAGFYAVNYIGLIPVIVEALKDQRLEIEKQQKMLDELKGNTLPSISLRSPANETETTGMVDPVISQCKLYQNAPNPFTHSTEIKYYLSDDVSTAFLCIYNLQGRELKQMNLNEHGAGSQMIHGHELPAGMYLYALIVDGKEVDTKRMILTK